MYFFHTVVKRSPGSNALVTIGKAAEDFLLKGTYYKQIDSSGYKLFEKQGQFSDALRDFNTVRPKNAQIRNQSTHSHIFRKQVKVGDRKIQLRHNYNDVGTRGLPQILISNPVPGELPYKIVYTKNKR